MGSITFNISLIESNLDKLKDLRKLNKDLSDGHLLEIDTNIKNVCNYLFLMKDFSTSSVLLHLAGGAFRVIFKNVKNLEEYDGADEDGTKYIHVLLDKEHGKLITITFNYEEDDMSIIDRSFNQEEFDKKRKESMEKDKPVNVVNTEDAKSKVSDIEVFGNADIWKLVCKASSKEQGWMKSTKAMVCAGGVLVQVSTKEKEGLAEAITFIPGATLEALPQGGYRIK